MFYYQFNIGDYAAETKGLSLLEDLAYRRILDLYYKTERPLNECLTDVAREIGMREQQQEVEYVVQKYFTLTPDGWFQKRAEREVQAYQSKKKSASKAGKASAEARRIRASEQTFNDRSTTVQPNIKHKTLNIKQETDIKPTSPPKAAPCPTQKIIEMFPERCPSLIQPRVIPDSVKAMIADRWRQSTKHQKIQFWEGYFDYCEELDFLTGRTNPSNGAKAFRVGLEWIVKAGNFAKIINGNYVNG